MCTSVYLSDGFFGRTLDFENRFGEELLFSPRSSFTFGEAKNRYSVLGIGAMREGYPMYFDGMNEWGLCAAALDFTGCARYSAYENGLPAGKLLAFVLGFCRSTEEAAEAITRLGIVGEQDEAALHWMIADKRGAIVVEQTIMGLDIRPNSVGVLTNSPPIDYHLIRLSDYAFLTAESPKNRLLALGVRHRYRGLGGVGLPGDFSSPARFVRASFLRENTVTDGDEVNRLFHILGGVSIPLGAVLADDGRPISTIYTSVMDMENLSYHFTTYHSPTPRKTVLTPEMNEGRAIMALEKLDNM